MSSASKKFVKITGVSTEIANQYLKKFKNNLEHAVDAYINEEEIRARSKKTVKHSSALLAIFNKYKDPNDANKIDIDGTMAYLEDLSIEPEDIKSLVLAYFLQSPCMGLFLKESFLAQWSKYSITTLSGMKDFIASYYQDILSDTQHGDDSRSFQKLYNFTFGFLLENENQKLLDYELVIEYWKLLLPLVSNSEKSQEVSTRLEQWYDFLANEYKRPFSKDMWSMFYLFVKEVISTDPTTLKEYDEMAAWPSVMDEYVEYLRENELISN